MHERFVKDKVKIENLYHFSVQSDNPILSGVIVAIYQKMCEDGILRDRVLTEVGKSTILPYHSPIFEKL